MFLSSQAVRNVGRLAEGDRDGMEVAVALGLWWDVAARRDLGRAAAGLGLIGFCG